MHALRRTTCLLALLGVGVAADAATLNVVALFPGKAFVSVDSGAPRAIAIGETAGGYRLVAVGRDDATFVVDGRRETIALGSYVAGRSDRGRATAVLGADRGGHYTADGFVNGVATRFLVDTGATLVVMSSAEADRLALAWKQAPRALANTANGTVGYRLVKLDRIRVGDVELRNVDAGVMEGGYDGPMLLGMSFLSRTEVSRDGQSMVLTRRY